MLSDKTEMTLAAAQKELAELEARHRRKARSLRALIRALAEEVDAEVADREPAESEGTT